MDDITNDNVIKKWKQPLCWKVNKKTGKKTLKKLLAY